MDFFQNLLINAVEVMRHIPINVFLYILMTLLQIHYPHLDLYHLL
nr:MAG TPA: hypothetical protein [Crassvirales sp.]